MALTAWVCEWRTPVGVMEVAEVRPRHNQRSAVQEVSRGDPAAVVARIGAAPSGTFVGR